MVGGGNTAVEEAIYLTHHASHVTLVHRRDVLRAERIMQERLFAHPKIARDLGQRGRRDPRRRHARRGGPASASSTFATGEKRTLALDGVFVAIGHTPNTMIFEGQVEMDRDGYILTSGRQYRAPPCLESLPQVTCRIASTARPSPPPQAAAWRLSMPKSFSRMPRERLPSPAAY